MKIGDELVRNTKKNEAYKEWVDQRKDTLKDRVSAHDVLRHFGIALKYSGSDKSEQICCPFHGDSDPSARIHANEGDSSSAVYCFVCRERWDIFKLWARFNNEPEMKFTAVLAGLERAFGITTPEVPKFSFEYKPSGPSDEEVEVKEKLDLCERRLRMFRNKFTLQGFLIVGKVLDQLHFQLQKKSITSEVALRTINLVLSKISEKSRG
jgi:hypothetical protein